MPSYQVAVVNEHYRPAAIIEVEAISLDNWPDISAVETTGRNGVAIFTGLTGPHYFRPRIRRTSTSVGERIFIGEVRVQLVDFSSGHEPCYDAVVNTDGTGSHTTLESAIDDMIAEAGSSGRRTIWMCSSVTEGNISLNAFGDSAVIVIDGPERTRFRITAPSGEDIFTQSADAGAVGGVLVLKNMEIATDSTHAYYFLNAALGGGVSALANVRFYNCGFSTAGYLMRSAGHSLESQNLRVEGCTGTLVALWRVPSVAGNTGPNEYRGLMNFLTLTRFWESTTGTATPSSGWTIGGKYDISGQTLFGSTSQGSIQEFRSLAIRFSGAVACFAVGSTQSNCRNLVFDGISFRISDDDGFLGSFGSAAVNPCSGLFLKNIFAYTTGVTAVNNLVTIDADYDDVHMGNVLAIGFPATGQPSGTGEAHSGLTGLTVGDDHTQYLLLAGRSGGQTVTGGTGAGENLNFIPNSVSGGAVRIVDSPFSILDENEIRLFDSGSSNFIAFRSNTSRTTDIVYVLPTTDPTAGQVLSAGAPSGGVSVLSWAGAAGGGIIDTLLIFTPLHNEPPTSNPATFDTRNLHPVLDFDGATDETAIFTGVMPQEYAAGGVLVLLHITVDGTSGDTDWQVAFERIGSGSQDIDSDGFAAAQTTIDTVVPATSGHVQVISIAFTHGAQMDSVVAGELFRLQVVRDASTDTNTDDAQLLAVEIRNA